MIYSWLNSTWNELWASGRGLPHALLLIGPEGIGKRDFAISIAERLLCESPVEGQPCGSCSSCHWFEGGNHPDFRHVRPEAETEQEAEGGEAEKKKASRQILIDQIRGLESFVFVGGHRGGARVAVIEPAETMNVAAQNSLLKILEEPPSSVYFILVSSQWRRLLPTIRSRCRTLKLPRPDIEEARRWIEHEGDKQAAKLLPMMGGAPLSALKESRLGKAAAITALTASLAEPGNDALALAARWESLTQAKNDEGMSMEGLVAVVQKWLFDLCQLKLAGRLRYAEAGMEKGIRNLLNTADTTGLLRCYNELISMRALASHPLNPRLFLEDLAARYLRALAMERP